MPVISCSLSLMAWVAMPVVISQVLSPASGLPLTDNKYDSAEEAIETLKQGILEANDMLSETVKEHPELEGMGTTFSGMLIHGDQIITAHIGDSRIYRGSRW
jgi:serine/threonine protein phosphatase PrpC